jgi:hypothetical protein
MKSLVFDTGSVISLAMNNLLWVLKPLKKKFGGDFILPLGVKYELIDRPLNINRFKLDAVVIRDYLMEGVFKLASNKEIERKSKYLLSLANNIYFAKNKPIKIIQDAEMDALALVLHYDSGALVLDERTLRLLVEDPESLGGVLSNRLHTKVKIDRSVLIKFRTEVKKVNIIRSTELIVVAYGLGIMDKYISVGKKVHNEFRKDMLSGALWGLKYKGCAISVSEINEILRLKNL